jgi:hypothetical protein
MAAHLKNRGIYDIKNDAKWKHRYTKAKGVIIIWKKIREI